ncbi:hypothetical protein WH50_19775 [Pokkaliibacter plantistimulans]|uniref:Uncharacterized protein n=1 Tax=Pokkaliibacter plantistimulans TaxID=1635171 RepID=A0ABX5LVX3_9GAMM|nr:hypothetical protein WH50_19775 [Pokkaliibacter plantistimulans]
MATSEKCRSAGPGENVIADCCSVTSFLMRRGALKEDGLHSMPGPFIWKIDSFSKVDQLN